MESAGKKNSNGGKINWEEAQDCSFVLDVQWCHQKHWEDPQVLLQPSRRLQGWNTKQIFCTPFFCWMSVNNCRTLSVLALITFSVLQREILSVLNAGFRQVFTTLIMQTFQYRQKTCTGCPLTSSTYLSHVTIVLPKSMDPYTTDCSCSRSRIPKIEIIAMTNDGALI